MWLKINMINHLKNIILFLLTGVLLSNCGRIDEITIGEIEQVKLKGFEDNAAVVDVIVPIDNPSMHRIKITDLNINTYIKGRYIGKLQLGEELIVKGRTNDRYDLPIRIRVTNFIDLVFLMANIKTGYTVDIKFTGSVTAKAFLIKRQMKIDEERKIVF